MKRLLCVCMIFSVTLLFAQKQKGTSVTARAAEAKALAESEPEESPQDESTDGDEEEPQQTYPAVPGATYTDLGFDGMERDDVERFRQMYLSEKWARLLNSYLESAVSYRLYVRKSVREQELPAILEYLPVVESNYKTNAKSKSGALGLWQFMENSVRPFLTINEFLDERLDPWKSTDAALAKLQDNYKIFDDWLLAIAAYNCGAGAMSRILKKAGVKDYWYLVDNGLLPEQTAHYVPKLLAIADLAINSDWYGISLASHDEEYESLYNERNAVFDYLEVNKAYSITHLAQEMRMDETTMKELNPSFTRGMTHPSQSSRIRLPEGMLSSAQEALGRLSPIEFPFQYKVVKGDSLWSISRKYGVSVQTLCETNGIKETDILRIGKILYIPSK